MTEEKFQLEITLEDGQITEIVSLNPEEVHVDQKKITSLDQFKPEQLHHMRHGSMILTGQNSPGWIIIKSGTRYIRVWR